MDIAARHPDAETRREADALVALITPVVKAAFTDFGFETAVASQQVFGGHGYIREWGMEQYVRDARIAQIYEGTNGVQAMDLVTRKLALEEGRLARRFFARIRTDLAAAQPAAGDGAGGAGRRRPDPARGGDRSTARGRRLRGGRRGHRLPAPVRAGRVRVDVGAHGRRRGGSARPPRRSSGARSTVARFFVERMLPETKGLAAAIEAGAPALMALEPADF